MTHTSASPGPLAGIMVLEFCQIASGPFCGMLLADMGADVIKIEPPEGDGMRRWPPINHGYSENFASLNRNKRSIVLDLKNAEDAQIARRMAARADVLIENNRPAVMQRPVWTTRVFARSIHIWCIARSQPTARAGRALRKVDSISPSRPRPA